MRWPLLDKTNIASSVWAERARGPRPRSGKGWQAEGDTACRSAANEAHLARNGFRSRVHFRRKPGFDLTPSQRKANRAHSALRSAIETVFAAEKHRFGLVVRTIGCARAATKIGLANLAYNIRRFIWIDGRRAPA